MNEKVLHLDFFINTISQFFNRFWFLFLFLLILNVLDVITGEIKAKYLRVESSRIAAKGLYKKVFLWILITITLGLSLIFLQIGEVFNVKIGFMVWLGRLVVLHAIINEFRSIIENIIACDKGNIVPNWLKKGLEVTQKTIDKKSIEWLDKLSDALRDEETRKKVEQFLEEEAQKKEEKEMFEFYNKKNNNIKCYKNNNGIKTYSRGRYNTYKYKQNYNKYKK